MFSVADIDQQETEMKDTTRSELIEYSLCTEGDVEGVCDLLAEVFSRREFL